MPTPLPLRWWLRFAALSLIWGMSFLLIAVAGRGFTPAEIAFGRTASAAVVLNVALVLGGQRLPRSPRVWLHVAVGALLVSSAPFTLFAVAEQRIPSTLAGIANATTPLFTVVVVRLMQSRDDRDRRTPAQGAGARRRWPGREAGLAIGFAGVLLVLGPPGQRGVLGLAGVAMALTAAVCYGIGWPYVTRTLHPGRPGAPAGLALPAALLTAAAVQTCVIAVITPHTGVVTLGPLAALVALGVAGTGLAYVLQVRLLTDGGATMTSLVTYVIPVVSTAAGTVLLGEPVHANEPLGAVVVLAGAYLAQRSRVGITPKSSGGISAEEPVAESRQKGSAQSGNEAGHLAVP